MGQASDAYIDYLHTQCVFIEQGNGDDNNDHKEQRRRGEFYFLIQMLATLTLPVKISKFFIF